MDTQISGIFDGESMVGEDNKIYPVNPNYASKSKLVVGDELKLEIDGNGSFFFKQLNRVQVNRIRGVIHWESGKCFADVPNGTRYKVLHATATYFRLKDDEEVILLVPRDKDARWAAIENAIRAVPIEKELVE